MKRTKTLKTEDPEAILWEKTGGGHFVMSLNGQRRIIKPYQKFLARVEDIPLAFRDTVVPVDPEAFKAKTEPKKLPIVDLEYTLVPRGGGYYNVVDVNGKVMNEKALRKEAAGELISSLK